MADVRWYPTFPNGLELSSNEWSIHPSCASSSLLLLATLPGMWDRTITVGSAGKTFSATGWKVLHIHTHAHMHSCTTYVSMQMGWGIGPEHFVKHMQTMHANTGYCYPTLLQVMLTFKLLMCMMLCTILYAKHVCC